MKISCNFDDLIDKVKSYEKEKERYYNKYHAECAVRSVLFRFVVKNYTKDEVLKALKFELSVGNIEDDFIKDFKDFIWNIEKCGLFEEYANDRM